MSAFPSRKSVDRLASHFEDATLKVTNKPIDIRYASFGPCKPPKIHGFVDFLQLESFLSRKPSCLQMARQKPATVTRREPSELHAQANGVVYRDGYSEAVDKTEMGQDTQINGSLHSSKSHVSRQSKSPLNRPGFVSLVFCVCGIYASL